MDLEIFLPRMLCPICKKPVLDPSASATGERGFFPFCSDRCKLIDLGRWLDGKYQIPVEKADDDDEPQPESEGS